ncbi:MAG: pimeloyl-ACP methyl ester carboxylesterase [Cryomorphaceae bacterium]|jgi:pimeloyl-ACP methyl ester carboxylesterase
MMKIIDCSRWRYALMVLVFIGLYSCSDDDDLSDLSDTIMLRHKDADMPVYIFGNGSEKVFLITLHGGPGGMGLGFRGTAFNSIENACGVVYFDQRGSGMSQGSYSDDGISIDIMAEDVLALVKVLKLKYGSDSRFFLLGHSWGGTLATATLLKDQRDFLGWIQVDGTHSPRDMYAEYLANLERVAAEQIIEGNSIPFWESVNELVAEVDPVFNRDDIARLNGKAFDAEDELSGDDFINSPSGGRDDLVFQYNLLTFYWNLLNTQSLLDPDIQGILSYTDRLAEITTPTLILWGEYDMVVPMSIAEEAYANIGSSEKRLVIFEKSGHSPMGSVADLFSAEVNQFIDQHK